MLIFLPCMKLYSKTSEKIYLQFTKIKLKCLEKLGSAGLFIKSGKLYQVQTSKLVIIFGGTLYSLVIRWI